MIEGQIVKASAATQPSWLGAALTQKKIPTVVVVGEYLKNIGEFRHNVRSHKVEVKVQDEKLAREFGTKVNEWAELTDRIGNTMLVQMKAVGIEVSKDTLYTVLDSSFSTQYDPVMDYLDNLKPWDGVTDHLKEVTDRLVLEDNSEENRRYLEMCFKKWMARMVRSWLSETEFNEYILFLIGGQGAYKTTFIKYLLPPMLCPYMKEHFNVEMINKDTRIELSENLLINIDDVSKLDKTMNGALKNLTSLTHVKERRAYGRNAETYTRNASFAATSNVLHILTDETGNRRWLTFHIKEINPSPHPEKGVSFDYEGIYGQVKALIEHGYDYEFSKEDCNEIDRQNRKFMVVDVAEELIRKYYKIPEEGGTATRLGAAEVYKNITGGKNIPGITPVEIGKTLTRMGFESGPINGIKKYKLQLVMPFEDTSESEK